MSVCFVNFIKILCADSQTMTINQSAFTVTMNVLIFHAARPLLTAYTNRCSSFNKRNGLGRICSVDIIANHGKIFIQQCETRDFYTRGNIGINIVIRIIMINTECYPAIDDSDYLTLIW